MWKSIKLFWAFIDSDGRLCCSCVLICREHGCHFTFFKGLFVDEPNAEDIGLTAILLPLWPPLVFLLKKWHAWHIADQESNEKRGIESDPSPFNTYSKQPDTPPKDSFSKVIWMSCVSPKAMLDELLLAWGLVGQVILKLIIADPFDCESQYPNYNASIIRPNEMASTCWVDVYIKCCTINDEREESLHAKDIEEGSPVVTTLTTCLGPSFPHILVSKIFLSVSLADMDWKSESPNGYQRKSDVASHIWSHMLVREESQHQESEGRPFESKTPEYIDVTIVFLELAPYAKEHVEHKYDYDWKPKVDCLWFECHCWRLPCLGLF